ncbi:MAG: hypothetical protein ACMUEM_06950 [Flavobacteriales bacterium AspAUS03]
MILYRDGQILKVLFYGAHSHSKPTLPEHPGTITANRGARPNHTLAILWQNMRGKEYSLLPTQGSDQPEEFQGFDSGEVCGGSSSRINTCVWIVQQVLHQADTLLIALRKLSDLLMSLLSQIHLLE